MKYFSLFSGIGGFEIGIGTKHTCVGYSEIDKYAIQIYEKHFPTHKNYGDITKIDGAILPDFHILVGGFPCQSFSIAGRRGGFNDIRGTLFFEICRVLREKHPPFLLLENVKGLLSHEQGRTFATILASLDELGYDLQWQVLNSKNHGVPQNRERVYIIGHIRGTPPDQKYFLSKKATATLMREIKKGRNGLPIPSQHGTHREMREVPIFGQTNRVHSKKGISPTIATASGGRHIPMIQESGD